MSNFRDELEKVFENWCRSFEVPLIEGAMLEDSITMTVASHLEKNLPARAVPAFLLSRWAKYFLTQTGQEDLNARWENETLVLVPEWNFDKWIQGQQALENKLGVPVRVDAPKGQLITPVHNEQDYLLNVFKLERGQGLALIQEARLELGLHPFQTGGEALKSLVAQKTWLFFLAKN